MTTVSFKEAAILSYLDKRKDLSDAQRTALEKSIKSTEDHRDVLTRIVEALIPSPVTSSR